MKINLHKYSFTEKIFNLTVEIIQKVLSLKDDKKVGFFGLLKENILFSSLYSSLYIDGCRLNKEQISLIANQKKVRVPFKQLCITKNTYDLWSFIPDCNGLNQNDLFLAYGELSKNLIDETQMIRDWEIPNTISSSLIPNKLSDLFKWLKNYELHMLLKSCIFHFEILTLQPFVIENGKIARAWQIALLSTINPIFKYIELEKQIYLNKQEYLSILASCQHSYDSTRFIEFLLNLILKSLNNLQRKLRSHIESTSNEMTKLLLVISDEPKSSAQIMKELKLKNQPNFYRRYLKPALKQRLIQRTDPNPKSRNQKYIRRNI